MNTNRKVRNSQNILANKHSYSSQKLQKSQHLLSKPKLKKNGLQKNQQSFSTMLTNTFHKSLSAKINKTCVIKKNNDDQLSGQLEILIKMLQKQLNKIYVLQNERQINWNQTIQKLKSTVNNKKLKSMISLLQQGYIKQNIEIQKQKNNDRKFKQQMKKQKLSLNIGKINKENIIDYHDEFMSKIQQFSHSWREMLKLEKKSM